MDNLLSKLSYIETSTHNPAFNLALEECLLDNIANQENGIFMLWQNAPAVIIGRHQNALEEINADFLKENNIALVRRTTGGGAVYHDLGNLNFSFIVPTSQLKIDFNFFLTPIIEALQALGIPAELSGRNDITVNNHKISGSAQTRTKGGILHHGTMLVHLDDTILNKALTGNPDKYTSKGIASHSARVGNVKDFLSKAWSADMCMSSLKALLKKHVTPEASKSPPYEIPQYIIEQANQLAKKRYASEEWNIGKNPPFTATKREKFAYGAIRVSYNVNKMNIVACKIEGDFFSLHDIHELEKTLEGIPYSPENIKETLYMNLPSRFILNANNEELIDFFSTI